MYGFTWLREKIRNIVATHPKKNIPIQKENSTTEDEKMIKIEDENTAYKKASLPIQNTKGPMQRKHSNKI